MITEKILKDDKRQIISIVYDEVTEKKYIKRRIFDDKRDIFRLIKSLNHPNLSRIVRIEFDTETVVYEEYIDACPLTEIMEKHVRIEKKEVRKIAVGIISAIEALHSVGIIHRDVKPDNIMVDKDFNVWLIDYDIAKIYRPEFRKDTEQLGTFGYAPIEQYGIMPTDFKTDIYSFGVTLCNIVEYAYIKGKLLKIGTKCKMLDPALRYENASKVKKELKTEGYTCIYSIVSILLIMLVAGMIFYVANNTESLKNNSQETAVAEKITNSDRPSDESKNSTESNGGNLQNSVSQKEEGGDNQVSGEVMEDDDFFSGYSADSTFLKYQDYFNFHTVCVFSTPWDCDHLVMLEDGTKKGKTKLGRNTIVDSEFTLKDGVLAVSLKDDSGHKFSHSFYFDNQYKYDKYYTGNLRKNADMICKDLDYDGSYELLIGLGESVIGEDGLDFYNHFNYCIGWCICYDESTGFTLCQGDMFSRTGPFKMSPYTGNIEPGVSGKYRDPFIIYMENKKLISMYT